MTLWMVCVVALGAFVLGYITGYIVRDIKRRCPFCG